LNDKTKFDPETKIKGDLFADPMVNTIRSRLRDMITSDFGMEPGSALTALKDIGLETSGANFGKEGTLTFDTAKFNKAMTENPQGVMNLLGGGMGDMATKGMANKYKDFVRDYVMADGRLSKTIKGYDKQISDVKKRIDDFNRRIEDFSFNIKLKFSRLEAMLGNLDGQRETMAMQLGQLGAK
jgi:flagellar hook-associated protein 2